MKRIVTLCALAMFAGCMPITVQHDYDPDIDFSAYDEFAWMPLSADTSVGRANLRGPFLDKHIRKAIASGLADKGLSFTLDAPDVLVAFQVHYRNRSHVEVSTYGYRGYPYAVDERRSREATLVVDFVDPVSGDLLWRGWAVSDVQQATSPRQEQELIARAVGKLLERFPPHQEGH